MFFYIKINSSYILLRIIYVCNFYKIYIQKAQHTRKKCLYSQIIKYLYKITNHLYQNINNLIKFYMKLYCETNIN